jgi:hypothetical protein
MALGTDQLQMSIARRWHTHHPTHGAVVCVCVCANAHARAACAVLTEATFGRAVQSMHWHTRHMGRRPRQAAACCTVCLVCGVRLHIHPLMAIRSPNNSGGTACQGER